MRTHTARLLLLILALVLWGCGGGATSGDPLGTDSITVKAEPATVGAGQESVITATVARINELPATERTVSFTFRTNQSGGTLHVVNDRVDGQSQARAIYTAGWNAPGVEIADTIQASLSNGAGAVVTITRSGNGIAEMKAEPTEVAANQSSVVTVSVTDSSDKPISGLTVFFSITVNHSGSPSLTAYSGVTDGLGNATTVYTPGNASPDQTVSDTVEARLSNGSSRSVVITRKGSETGSGFSITATAEPTKLTGKNGNSIVTATVTTSTGTAISGVPVTFTVSGAAGGTVFPATAVTDSGGNATTVYKGDGVSATGSSNAVTAGITIGGNAYTAAVIIAYP